MIKKLKFYLAFLFSSNLLTIDYYFHPTEAKRSPRTHDGLWFLSLTILSASGMTNLF